MCPRYKLRRFFTFFHHDRHKQLCLGRPSGNRLSHGPVAVAYFLFLLAIYRHYRERYCLAAGPRILFEFYEACARCVNVTFRSLAGSPRRGQTDTPAHCAGGITLSCGARHDMKSSKNGHYVEPFSFGFWKNKVPHSELWESVGDSDRIPLNMFHYVSAEIRNEIFIAWFAHPLHR